MTALVLALQVILPLALIAWLAFLPAGSLAGFVLQTAGIGAFLFALARVAQWAVPVWWLPWAYGGLWLVAVLRSSSRWRGSRNGRCRSGGCPGPMAVCGWWPFWHGSCVRALLAGLCVPARQGDGRSLRCR